MGVLVIILLVLSAFAVLFSRRDKETLLIVGLGLSLAEFWLIMLIYISKKGGFRTNLETLLFGTRSIRLFLQYLIFTLGQLGFVMAIGRYLFPLFLIWLSIFYCKRISREASRWLFPVSALLPILSLVVYYPKVFEWLIGMRPNGIQFIVQCSLGWIVAYLVISLGLLLLELHDTTMRFYRRHLGGRVAMIVSLMILYILYCPQDPAQVYLFYRNEYMGAQQGLWYLNPALSSPMYIFVFSLAILCSACGVYGMMRYAWNNILEGQQENAIRRKFDAASKDASVFIHSVKNQLLANQVLLKRMDAEIKQPVPNLKTVADYQQLLSQNNSFMIERMEELYRSIRTNSIVLVEEKVQAVCDLAIERTKKKYPEIMIECVVPKGLTVLCDKNHLAEALYNLLVNGWEAQIGSEKQTQPIFIYAQQERLWTVLNITDHGRGLSKAQRKHMFDPFWSSKNTNYNWGMGLYYVRQIVKSHLGVLRIETVMGKGTTVVVQLPRFDRGE